MQREHDEAGRRTDPALVYLGPFGIRWIHDEEWATVEPWLRDAKLIPVWLPCRNPYTLVAEREGRLVGALSMT